MQEVGKALESEVCVGGECLSGLDPEVIVVLLDAVSPVRGGERMWVAAGLEVGGCQVAQAHLQSPAACVHRNEGLLLDPPS